MVYPASVSIMEVCPRDGWQNHPVHIDKETKIKYIKKMMDYGARRMDVTSFVNPKYVPQMDDSAEVVQGVQAYAAEHGCILEGLTLNAKGVQRAIECGLQHVSFVLSVSEEHNLRNSRRTIEESRQMFRELVPSAKGLQISLALPCVFGSPFGDEIDMGRVRDIIEEAMDLGIQRIGLADTAGLSNPKRTREVLQDIKRYMPPERTSIHIHDARGLGLANTYVALEEGYINYDASLGGMGGCPFAPGAKGNIATEDLVNLCESMGIETGYDLDAVIAAAHEMSAEIDAELTSSMARVCSKDAE